MSKILKKLIFAKKKIKLERWKDYAVEITSIASNASKIVPCVYYTVTIAFLSYDLLALYIFYW